MMKRFTLVLIAALLMLWLPCALAEDQAPLLDEEGWAYIGYIDGGITFAVPRDYMSMDLSTSDIAQGYVLMGGNADFTMQLRVFPADEMRYDDFKALILQESTAEASTRMDEDSEILVYRNTRPSANSELYGIALTGLDGLLYKISIFTGADDAFGSEAPVWEIAETLGQSVCHQDFSEWGVPDAPDFSAE